jgi:WD40 repeat protein
MNVDHEGDATNSSSDSISSQEIDEEEESPRRNIVCLPPFFTAGFDKEIRCYRNGDCVARLTEHKDWVRFMSVNQDGSRMLSGSVNSNIFGWDTTTCRPVFTITPAHEAPSHLQHSLQGINSINGLEWTHVASPVFASGAGDGSIKLWDARTLSCQSNTFASVGTILAHDGKLNNLLWLQDDRFMLSSGRDDVIRLLDMRMIGDCSRGISDNLSSHGSPLTRDRLVIREYTGHTCSGYNIQAALWDKDRFIVTGSRDGKIHVFETSTGKLVNLLSGPVQPTHLVVPLPEKCGPGLISATAVSAHIFVWGPASTTENTPESDLVPADVEDDDSLVEMARQEALENTISQFGERFLRALRQDGAGSRVFFDDQVRSVYYHHMYHALQRRGRTHLVFPANYQPPQIQQGPQQPGPQDPRGPNAMAEG